MHFLIPFVFILMGTSALEGVGRSDRVSNLRFIVLFQDVILPLQPHFLLLNACG